ncbi:IGS10 protein, partial [Bucco capensis]|nr:IGS10 protein [Bucco capensis]
NNLLTSLPPEMFSYLSELESLYLHGNPWSCDCSLWWFADWAKRTPDVLKCKKDRSSGAQQCPVCASPKSHKGRSLMTIPPASLTCWKPTIEDSLKLRNLSVSEDGDFSSISPRDFLVPIGSVVLNMTDQAGSQGNLVCNIQKPQEMSPISFGKDGNSTVLKTSFSATLVCAISDDHLQQLWSILALYSNSSLKLERTVLTVKEPSMSYRYKQICSEKDELFTSVEAELRADPLWLMQSQVALQLDRTATTLDTLHIHYSMDAAQVVFPSADEKKMRSNWTIIFRDNQTQTEQTVLVGGTVELECQATGEPAPAVEWILADGSKIRAPHISEDGRILVVQRGTLTLRNADTFDSGLYHCIGTTHDDADTLTFRVTVVDPEVEPSSVNGARLSAAAGSSLDLPCPSSAVPDAAISWVLPEHMILHRSVRNRHIFDNGTLRIQAVTERDSGYFRCVAANQYGVDLLVFQVLVRKDETLLKEKQVAVGGWDEGEGSGDALLASATTQDQPSATFTARQESAASASIGQVTQSTQKRNSHGIMAYKHYRDRTSRRFRGQRRQFVSSARRVDPQHWATLLEKMKRNWTLTEKGGEIATQPPTQVPKFSEVLSEDEEETSGYLRSPEEELMMPVTEGATVSPLGRAVGSVRAARPEMTTRNTPARRTSLLVTEEVALLPSPFPHSVSSDSRPQSYLNPTTTVSCERTDLSQISANSVKQSAVPPTSQAQQHHGKRRKTSGRRRTARPGHVPGTKKHRYAFGRPGPARGSAAVAAGVQLNTEYVPNLAALNHFSSSIKPSSPEAPLSSPSTMNMSVEHPADTCQSTMFLREEEKRHSARQKAATTVVPFLTKGTQDTPPWKLDSSAPVQANTHRVHPSSATLPTAAIHTAHAATEMTHTISTKVSSTLESVSPSTEPRTSPKNSQRGKIPWEQLFGNGAQKEALEKQPNQQTDVLPPTEVLTTLPETTAASSMFTMSPLRLTPIPMGGFLSLNTPLHDSKGRAGEHLPAAKPRAYSHPATSASKEMDGTRFKPTVTPVIASQTDTKTTRSKAVRVGRKRGQRRRRPPKTSASHSVTAGHGTTTSPAVSTATPAGTAGRWPPASLTPAEAPSGRASTALGTEAPALWIPDTPGPPLPLPAATQTGVTLLTPRDVPSATSPSSTHVSHSPNMPRLAKASSTSTKPPATASGAEPALQIKATTTAGGKSHLKREGGVIQEDLTALPTVAARTEPRSRAPAVTPPSTQHPTPLPAPTASVTPPRTMRTTLPPWEETRFWQKPSVKATERDTRLPVSTLTTERSSQVLTPYAPRWGRDKDGSVKGWAERRQDQDTTTPNTTALDAFSRNYFSKPRIIGGQLAAFTVLANSDAFIPCEATGSPQPTIEWSKVSSGTGAAGSQGKGHWLVLANGTLSIAQVGLEDRGQYLCIATNPHGTARLLVTLSVVAYPPHILGGRWHLLTTHSGEPVALRCKAEGRPPPAISWVLANRTQVSSSSAGNNKVQVGPDGTLTIRDVTVYDRGLYTCLAENPAGTDTLAVKLQVIAAPPAILEEKREHVRGTMGESLRLPCTVKGNPQPSIYWVLFDGTVVKPLQLVNSKLFLYSNGTLQLSDMAPADSGNYECIATSSTGSERRVVSLVVEPWDTLPKITTTSQGMTRLNLGDKLLLNCTATGEPKPRIIWRLPSKAVIDQWHRMGSRIHVYPNGSLAIKAVTEKDAGDYLCVARNKMGDDLILMKVSITLRPAKIEQKQYFKKLVPYGKDFQVDCKASGSPTPEISWSLPDGTVISSAMLAHDNRHRSRRYVLFDNGTLYLHKAGAAEGGDYICYAQNRLGRDQMKIHIVVVMEAPQIQHNYRTHSKVRAGDTALLHCEAVGEPKPKIFWLLPSSDMISSSTGRRILHPNGSLSVSQAKLSDAGEYVCVARNPRGDDTKLYELEVVAKPPIINGFYVNRTVMKVTAVRHSKKQIDCRAEGTPPPQVMWIMPDNIFLTAPYYGSRIVVYRNGTLEIRNIRTSDAADLICVARNDGGESMLLVQLEVSEMLRRPTFKNPHNEKIIAKPGKTIILNCSVDGNPPPDISWMLPNGTWFPSSIRTSQFIMGSNGTLTIHSPDGDMAGKYRCAARNQVGYIEKLIILEMGQKPNILTYPEGAVKGISGQSLSLHCLSEGSPKPTTSWILPSGSVLDRPQISRRHILLENGTLVIREATIHDRGDYVCRAHNNAGHSSITVPVLVVAYPPRINSRPPRTVHTLPGAAVQLHCTAVGIPKPEITWELPDHSVLSMAHQGRAAGSLWLSPPGTLLIQQPRPSDSGPYTCTARSHLGSDFTVTYIHII